jgi:hypothetical protein
MSTNVPFNNPLNAYVDPSLIPSMSSDGLVINKRYAITGIVDTINTTETVYPAPQTGQSTIQNQTSLINSTPPSLPGFTDFPKAVQGDTTITGMQFNLQVPSTFNNISSVQTQQSIFINYISFNFWDVPANWTLWYLDPITESMLQVTDANGYYVQGTTTGTNPFNWVFVEANFQTISTNLLEIRMNRNVNATPSANGTNIFANPYSFGVGNVNIKLIGYNDYRQVPDSASLASISSLGTSEEYVKIQRDSSQIQAPVNRTNPLPSNNYWRSQPQPVGDAVVCLYIDMGSSQTMDRMYLDPLYSGVGMNVYYSNDTTVNQPFYCSRRQTQFSQNDSSNPITFLNVGEQLWGPFGNTKSGAVFPSNSAATNAGLILPNDLQIDGTQNWAMGLQFTPNFGASTGTLINQGSAVKLSYSISGSNITFSAIVNSNTAITQTVAVQTKPSSGWVNPPYTIIFGYDKITESSPYVFMYVSINQSVVTNPTTNTVTASTSSNALSDTTIVLGNNAIGGATANGVISNFWLRQDVINSSIANAYVVSPRPFVNSYGVSSSLRGDYNALLLAPLNNANCYAGPSSEYYEGKSWTPLQGNFSLRKSTYTLPVFNAKYIKLEFTNLKPEPYQLLEPSVTRSYNTFPPAVINYWNELEFSIQNTINNNYYPLYTSSTGSPVTNVALGNLTLTTASGNFAQYQPPTLGEFNASQTGSAASTQTANQNAAVVDPTSSTSLTSYLDQNSSFYQTSVPFLIPKFYEQGIHNYTSNTIEQNWNQAYFVGLKALEFYKSDPIIVDDTEYYYDTCTSSPGTIVSSNSTSIFDNSDATLQLSNSLNNGVPAGYVNTSITQSQQIFTLPLSSFSPVTSFQLAATFSDWVSFLPIDHALFTNNNLSYITSNNCTIAQQITSWNINSGVYQYSQLKSNLQYGIQTQTISSLPSAILDSAGLRISAAVRFFLPSTSQGVYQLNLHATIAGIDTIIASKTVTPGVNTWTDLQVAYSIPIDGSVILTNIYTTFTQTNSNINEPFYVSMFSTFYNPISFAWSTDRTALYAITTTINDSNAYNSVFYVDPAHNTSSVYNFYVRVKAHTYGAYLNSILIAPQYSYNAYTPNASIDYYPDPRTNQVWSKVPTNGQPLFQFSSDFFPAAWSQTNIGIQ